MLSEDVVCGAIVGLAIGDALGYPAEFRSREAIVDSFGPQGLVDFVGVSDPRWPQRPYIVGKPHPPGTYTDDTQMSVAVAEGLLHAGLDADVDTLMRAIARAFVIWADSPDNDRAPGGTCMTGCARLATGVPWYEAGVADSKGCGSAMRVTAIGLAYADDEERLLEVARASSILTHGHDAAIEGAAACALAVAHASRGASADDILRSVRRACSGRSHDFDICLQRFDHFRDAAPHIALSSAGIGEAWVAEEAFASALYCFARHPDDYAAAVLCGANTDGDSDSIAAIAGSMSGARLGLRGIPTNWIERVESRAELWELGWRLREAMQRSSSKKKRTSLVDSSLSSPKAPQ